MKRCQLDGEIDRTLVLRWNGTRWLRAASPGPECDLQRAERGERRVRHQRLGGRPVVLRWNGTSWSAK